jgi:hypothetical protein
VVDTPRTPRGPHPECNEGSTHRSGETATTTAARSRLDSDDGETLRCLFGGEGESDRLEAAAYALNDVGDRAEAECGRLDGPPYRADAPAYRVEALGDRLEGSSYRLDGRAYRLDGRAYMMEGRGDGIEAPADAVEGPCYMLDGVAYRRDMRPASLKARLT